MGNNNQKREMFVFIGQNASTGTPHPTTGHMSYYGRVYRIDGTLKQARAFADYNYDVYNNMLCVAGGRRKMREFCLGMPGYVFNEYLNETETVFPDSDQDAGDWHIG